MNKVARSPIETPAETRYRKLLAEKRADESFAALAARVGLAPGTLSWWRHELRRRDRARAKKSRSTSTPQLLPVRVLEAAPRMQRALATYEIALAGGRRVIRVPADFEAQDVRALVAAVEGASC